MAEAAQTLIIVFPWLSGEHVETECQVIERADDDDDDDDNDDDDDDDNDDDDDDGDGDGDGDDE